MTDMQKSIDQLNSFLRGELSAVETYRQALKAVNGPTAATSLREGLQSHEQRVSILAQEIRRAGGKPAESSGPWGAFVKLVEGGATVLGEKAAIAALEEGEDHGNADYARDIAKLDPGVRTLVEQKLIPLQRRSHATMSALKKQLH